MKKKILNSFILLLITNVVVNAQCVTTVSATITYVSNSGGNCTYNFTPSALINSTPDVKLVEFTLPAGSTPAQVCYSGTSNSSGTITSVACGSSYFAITDNPVVIPLPTVSITMPCAASTIDLRASTATTGTSTCTGPTAITATGANPVKISYFKGIANNSEIGIYWQTEVETNSDYFVVERSGNAKEFSDLEQIKSTGESTSKIDYQYLDKNPFPGINYYRLRQVDKDGSQSYSKIIDIKSEGGASETMIFPNPSSGEFLLKSNETVISSEAYSMNGKKVDVNLEKKDNQYRLNFTNKPEVGTYILHVKTQSGNVQYRLFINQ